MVDIHAVAPLAEVVEFQAIWDRPNLALVHSAVGHLDSESAVTVSAYTSLPRDAVSQIHTISPDERRDVCRAAYERVST